MTQKQCYSKYTSHAQQESDVNLHVMHGVTRNLIMATMHWQSQIL